LSQEEIDALLKQSGSEHSVSAGGATVDEYLTPLEQDALGEIGNITFGSAATALSTLLGKKVEITTPKVSTISREHLGTEFPKPHVAVHVVYVDGFEGINSLVIKTRDAQVIADLMLGGEGKPGDEELNDIHISAVQEAMNQMMGSSATSMSTIFNRFVNISPPGIDILDVASGEGVNNLPADQILIKISFRLTIGDLIDSTIMQLLPIQFAKDMVNMLINGTEQVEQIIEETAAAIQAPEHSAAAPTLQQPAAPNQYGVPGQGLPTSTPGYEPNQQYGMPQHYGNQLNRNVNIQPVQFSNLKSGTFGAVDQNNLNLLMDIPLKVTVELGRTQKQIKDILEMSQGSIIELDKLAGEPVDILVNNKLIAKGEVVVIDENFGVRVTDILSQWDRLQKLQ
jgi:flagellar motor switch protein FliN/FliY